MDACDAAVALRVAVGIRDEYSTSRSLLLSAASGGMKVSNMTPNNQGGVKSHRGAVVFLMVYIYGRVNLGRRRC